MESVYVYDPQVDAWTELASMSITRQHHASIAVDGKLYVFGGFSAGELLSTAEVYDPASDSWAQGSSLTSARGGVVAATISRVLQEEAWTDRRAKLRNVAKLRWIFTCTARWIFTSQLCKPLLVDFCACAFLYLALSHVDHDVNSTLRDMTKAVYMRSSRL